MGLLLLLVGVVCYYFEPDAMVQLSRRLFDRFIERQATPVQTDAVVILDIDDASLKEYGQWPWPRYHVAHMMDRLWAAGASVVIFDVIFVEPDRTSPSELYQNWTKEFGDQVAITGLTSNRWDYDAIFAKSLAGGSSVLGCFLFGSDVPLATLPAEETSFYCGSFYEKGASSHVWLPQAEGMLAPHASLIQSASGVAFINTLPDCDNIIRSTPLVYAYGPGRIYPSLALEGVRLYAAAKKVGIIYDTAGVSGIQHIQIFDGMIPTDASGRLFVNYRSDRFVRYSVNDLLAGNIAPEKLHDKIVLIGTSAAGLQDLVSTPFRSEFPGVEVHATVVDNMLAGDILREPRWMFMATVSVMIIGGLILTLLIVRSSALVSFLVMFLADVLVIVGSYWLLQGLHLVVLPVEIVGAWGLVFVGVVGVKYWQEERGRKKVRGMFGTMVSANVLKYLEANPQSFSLSGVRADATMFFSDVAGFTTISEQLEPELLADLLNRYLSPMTDLIMNRGGYVDKYEGDAIMAEWGVPFPLDDHAAQACYAALEQQDKLREVRAALKAEFGHELYVRMGLNTGQVTAGNMGSAQRFQYTVMGDAVNQASRFESGCKLYDVGIMIGESTRRAIGSKFEVRLLDLLVVKGKTLPIKVFELVALAGAVSSEKRKVLSLYEDALRLHWDRNFTRALEKLDEAISLMPDPPSERLRVRICSYIEYPPPEGWGGEFVNKHK